MRFSNGSRTERNLEILLVILLTAILIVLVVRVADAHTVDRRTTGSYYSGAFGGCGSPLNGLYAASKWFGCGDEVMVVRPNGARVQVTILDRCQCGMDLSRGAFSKIGSTSAGLYRVALAKVHPGWRSEPSWASRWIRR